MRGGIFRINCPAAWRSARHWRAASPVGDSFVKAAVTAAGGMAAFGLPESFTRTEVVVA
jgi:hypothetical protein